MRLKFLDGARGIASLMVVIYHVTLAFPSYHYSVSSFGDLISNPPAWFRVTPLRLLASGQAAVAFFFVLSGLVLAIPFLNEQRVNYGQFLLKRICRIWLPFAGAILFSAALHYYLRMDTTPDWRNTPPGQLTFGLVFSDILLINGPENRLLDGPMWSLVHEMRVSIIFPLLMLFVFRKPATAFVAAVILHLISSIFFPAVYSFPSATWADTGFYVLFFVVGALLAQYRHIIASMYGRLSPFVGVILVLFALVLFAAPGRSAFAADSWMIASVLIVAFLLGNRHAASALETPVPAWLGRVSYSLYLIHLPILTAAIHGLGPVLPLWAIMAIAVPTALIAAELFYRAVEAPSMRLGKRLTRRRIVPAAATGV